MVFNRRFESGCIEKLLSGWCPQVRPNNNVDTKSTNSAEAITLIVVFICLFLFSVDYHAYFHSAYPFGFWLCHLHESSHISSNPRSASQ